MIPEENKIKYNWFSVCGLIYKLQRGSTQRDWMIYFSLGDCKLSNSVEEGRNTGTWRWLSWWKHLCINSISLNNSACTLNGLHIPSLDNK